jgi:formylglycine-generating enzyme required for sulfatase activity
MQRALILSLTATLLLACFEVAAATDEDEASRLQAELDANPQKRSEIAARAAKQNLQVLDVAAGPREGQLTRALVSGSGATFTDCVVSVACPEMVVVPASVSATMVGSPEDEPLRLKTEQLHSVSLPAFAVGRTEVSVVQYMECVDAGGCRHPEWAEPGGAHNIETGTGITYKSIAKYINGAKQPVVGISWHDAKAYTDWLAGYTGRPYRLLSETEWEYAARAGATTPYWWGRDARPNGKVMACCEGCGSARDKKGLFPVESFEPNPWGLMNVHGNVWEWVADYYCEDYASSPADGTARLEKSCPKQFDPEGLKIFRGGSCFYAPRQMRASMRLRNFPDLRNMTVGFRVARDLR